MFTLNCRGRLLVISQPIVMGIINTTPDSFYSNSRHASVETALKQAGQMILEGATILDIGGQSTRPGSNPLSQEEETSRVLPVIEAIRKQFPDIYLSIDTYQPGVAKRAVDAGADLINDISGGSFDPNMLSTVAELGVPYVCMHIKGDSHSMHQEQTYTDITQEVLDYFIHRIADCIHQGIKDIIIDPGFGFSKNSQQNFLLLKDLEVFHILQKPLLFGISRKSTIYKTLGIAPEESLNGTTVLNTAALLKGAHILRVHDVREAVEAIKLVNQLIIKNFPTLK